MGIEAAMADHRVPAQREDGALIPQLWNSERWKAAVARLPPNLHIPSCTLNGDDYDPTDPDYGELAVVVCFSFDDGRAQTALLSSDLIAWGLTFVEGK